MKLYKPTINEMVNSDAFQGFISDKLGNDLFISDPERADRLYEYAADGCDGSTHQEVIEDWREFVKYCELPDRCKEYLLADIQDCEEWHINNGSIDSIIG